MDYNYTGSAVTDTFATGQTALAWYPVVKGAFDVKNAKGEVTLALGDIKVVSGSTTVYGTFASDAARANGTLAGMTWKDEEGASTTHTLTANDKMAYKYDNVVVPQNDLPRIKAEMVSIPLVAKAYF